MKTTSTTHHTTTRLALRFIGCNLLLILLQASPVWGDTYYFDVNGAASGSGVTASGSYTNWTSQSYWSTSSAGTVATTNWVSGSDAIFAAGNPSVNYTTLLASGTTTVGSITKNAAGNVTISGGVGINLSSSSGIFDVASGGLIAFHAVLSGSSGLTKNGDGALSFGGGAANYTGDTTVNAGTLSISSGRMPTASHLIVNNSAVFRNFEGNNTVAGISSSSSTAVIENGYTSGSAILTINRASGVESFAGIIRNGGIGTLNITKSGNYTQRLSGTNTYTGGTTVAAGTLLVNGNSSAATGAVSVASGATLGGTGTIGGATTLAGGAFLSPGDNSLSDLTFSGALDISAVNNIGNLKFTLATESTSDKITSSTLSIGSGVLGFADFEFSLNMGFDVGTYALFDSTGITGSLDAGDLTGMLDGKNSNLSISGNSILLTVVPEPSTMALLGLAIAALLFTYRGPRKA